MIPSSPGSQNARWIVCGVIGRIRRGCTDGFPPPSTLDLLAAVPPLRRLPKPSGRGCRTTEAREIQLRQLHHAHRDDTMHTAWVRLNAVTFFGLTVLLGLSVLTALSTYLHQGRPAELRTYAECMTFSVLAFLLSHLRAIRVWGGQGSRMSGS